MGRIRTIKPEFPQSQNLGACSREARLLFLSLFTVVDDEGRARGAPRLLASLLYPYDDDAPALIIDWLDDLTKNECVQCYEIDGTSYIQIINWLRHQKIDHSTKSKLPGPPEASVVAREASSNDTEASTNAQDAVAVPQDTVAIVSDGIAPSSDGIAPDLGPRIRTLEEVAEEARASSKISPQAFDLVKDVAILECRNSQDALGYAFQIQTLLTKGVTPTQLLEAVRRGMESLKKPPRKFTYYEPIIAEVQAEEARPLPEVQYAANKRASHAKPNNHNKIDAFDQIDRDLDERLRAARGGDSRGQMAEQQGAELIQIVRKREG